MLFVEIPLPSLVISNYCRLVPSKAWYSVESIMKRKGEFDCNPLHLRFAGVRFNQIAILRNDIIDKLMISATAGTSDGFASKRLTALYVPTVCYYILISKLQNISRNTAFSKTNVFCKGNKSIKWFLQMSEGN